MSGLKLIQKITHGKKDNYRGVCDQQFLPVAHVLSQIQPEIVSGGAAVSIYFKGDLVAELTTGEAVQGQAWQANHMALSYSTGKAVLATLVHILVTQGFLNYDVPVARYWPEFAQQSKGTITLRHILSHQSGLYDIRHTISSAAQMLNWEEMLQAYECATPRFEAGSATAYQALSFGWLVGGVIEKVMHKSLAEVLEEYLVIPLGLQGQVYFGVEQAQLSRVSRPFPKAKKPLKPSASSNSQKSKKLLSADGRRPLTLTEKVISLSGINPYDAEDALVPRSIGKFDFYSDETLQAVIPAVNGVFTATALARIYAMLANSGKWEGEQLIRADVFHQLSMIHTYARDKVMPIPMHWRLGYHRVFTLGKRVPTAFGHIGYNGSGAWCDPTRGLSFSYIHNFNAGSITGDYRLWWLTQTVLQCADEALLGHRSWF